jgi:hypothetical protein
MRGMCISLVLIGILCSFAGCDDDDNGKVDQGMRFDSGIKQDGMVPGVDGGGQIDLGEVDIGEVDIGQVDIGQVQDIIMDGIIVTDSTAGPDGTAKVDANM